LKHVFCAAFAASLVSLSGKAQDYNFSGNLASLFNRINPSANVFEQRYGRLAYHNSNTVAELNTEGYTLKTNLPTYSQSWSLSAKVTIPLAAEGLPGGGLPTESFTEVGIACLSGGNALALGLQVYPSGSPVTRAVLAEMMQNGNELFDGQGDMPTTQETTTLLLRYNSTNRLLTAYSDGNKVFDLDSAADGTNSSTRVLDWGMTSQSVFQIAVFANSSNYKVAKDTPIQVDDFSFHIDGTASPTPGTITISQRAILLGTVGKPAQRYELQQSDNNQDWITVSTIYGTGGVVQIPLSADTTNAFFKLK